MENPNQQERTKESKGMSYQETMDYIDSLQVYGSIPGLASIAGLCEKLGNPQNGLTFVHIAGTNGKGSVLSFISTVLKEGGYRVGRYISPTISDYRERIQVNGKMISKKALCSLTGQVKEACEALVAEGKPHPTPFEVETAMAFLYFKEKNCSIVVLETGLGGELDATNIIRNTAVAVITSVSYDHMGILGNSLREIASAKAGILKPGCLAVTLRQPEEVLSVLREKSRELEIPFRVADAGMITGVKSSLEKQRFSYTIERQEKGKERVFKNMEITMAGRYQLSNAVLALEALCLLSQKGFPVTENALRRGMKEAVWEGRFQVLQKKPLFLVDGAHNRDGAAKLADSVRFYFTNKRIIYIMGILRDKEQEEIIRSTCSLAEHILTVPTSGPRGLSSYELACEVSRFHPHVTALDSVEEAAELSLLMAGKDTVIIAFGSLSYLGKIMKYLKDKQNRK